MTVEQLRDFPGFSDAWRIAGPLVVRFLNERILARARSGKCVIETAQAESAVQRELALLLEDFIAAGRESSEIQTAPRMKPLHSMEPQKSEQP